MDYEKKIEIPFGAHDSELKDIVMTTDKQKAKAYDEALRKIRPLYERAKKEDCPIWSTYEYIFPELAESEDERITRAINNMLPFIPDEAYANNGVTKEGVLNWLQKQKEIPLMDGDADLYFDNWSQHNDTTKRGCFEEGIRYAQRLQKEQKSASQEGWDDGKNMLEDIIVFVSGYADKRVVTKWVSFLKSLRPSWKPSEEQMNGLAHAINLDVYDAKRYGLDSLYNDLKKLK